MSTEVIPFLPDDAADVRALVAARAKTFPSQIITVTDAETHALAGAVLHGIRTTRKMWKQFMDPHIEGAMEAKRVAEKNRKRLVTDYEMLDDPLAQSEQAQVQTIGAYEDREARARAAEEARLQALAKQQAEERRLAEAVAREEEALTAASREEAQEIMQDVEEMLDAPVEEPQVSLGSSAPKTAGLSRPETWNIVIDSLDILLKSLIDSKDARIDHVLRAELRRRIGEAVQVPLRQRAVALKSALRIPGVRAISDRGYRIR
jgi:hypothetical protein